MRTFQEFSLLCEAIYDRDQPSDTPLEVGKIGRERKKTAPERKRTKAVGGGKTAPAKSYKPRKDIGKNRPKSTTQQQPTQKRGSAALSPKEAQRKAYLERKAKQSASKDKKKDLEKAATKLLSKKTTKTVDPNYKPQKSSGYSREERRAIRRQGRKLVRHLKKGIDKHPETYRPKGM